MNFFGRGVSAFFNQFFKWLFWNKTGQKLLFSILIVVIFFVFIKCGEVAAVEEVNDINYEVQSYYNSVINDLIIRLETNWDNIPNDIKNNFFADNLAFYAYYNNVDGSSYNNAKPFSTINLNVIFVYRGNQSFTATANDYLGISTYTMYTVSANGITFGNNTMSRIGTQSVYVPRDLFLTFVSDNWTTYLNAKKSGDTETIIALLEDINENLSNTEPTSETDSFVEVDSSAVDDVSSASVDNVFSNMTTNFANKFTDYDLTTVYSFVWNLNGTRITFYSDTLYNMIRGTFFETLLSMLWYYIFGHYAFVWLSNIIHKIKDGSILDGLEVNEVITKEML